MIDVQKWDGDLTEREQSVVARGFQEHSREQAAPAYDKRKLKWMICLTILASLSLPADNKSTVLTYEDRLRQIWGQDMKGEFDSEALRALADQPSLSRSEQGKATGLILHAAVKKDASFQDLLKRPELRKSMPLDMALSAYDYAVNNSEAALDHILAQIATEDVGADSTAIVVLSILDEWDRTIRAFRKHFVHTDGAGGTCKDGFKAKRAYLYPKKYAEMREAIEAPIRWALPLLPRKR